jgi:hypothetical protein
MSDTKCEKCGSTKVITFSGRVDYGDVFLRIDGEEIDLRSGRVTSHGKAMSTG